MAAGQLSTRLASADDAEDVAQLLYDFNTEFDAASPGVDILAERLGILLDGPDTIAILAGTPPVAVALVTLRRNVWFAGPVALLDELYVVPELRGQGIGTSIVEFLVETARQREVELIEINVDIGDVDARRFHERHGFSAVQPDTGEHALYYVRELGG